MTAAEGLEPGKSDLRAPRRRATLASRRSPGRSGRPAPGVMSPEKGGALRTSEHRKRARRWPSLLERGDRRSYLSSCCTDRRPPPAGRPPATTSRRPSGRGLLAAVERGSGRLQGDRRPPPPTADPPRRHHGRRPAGDRPIDRRRRRPPPRRARRRHRSTPTTAAATTTAPPPTTTTTAPSAAPAPSTVNSARASTTGQATWYAEAPAGWVRQPLLPFGTEVDVVERRQRATTSCVGRRPGGHNPGRVVDMSLTGFSEIADRHRA